MSPLRSRRKRSLDGTVPGIEYVRSRGMAKPVQDHSMLGQARVERLYMASHPDAYNPRSGFMPLPQQYQNYDTAIPTTHTPALRMPIPREDDPVGAAYLRMDKELMRHALAHCEPPQGHAWPGNHGNIALQAEAEPHHALMIQELQLLQAWQAPAIDDIANAYGSSQPNSTGGNEPVMTEFEGDFAHDLESVDSAARMSHEHVAESIQSGMGPTSLEHVMADGLIPNDQYDRGLEQLVQEEDDQDLFDQNLQDPLAPFGFPDPMMPPGM